MSNPEAAQKIDAKFTELKDGANFGNQISEKSAFGGVVREFECGAIYWHPQVAGGSANAVWGAIYQRFKALGAHDFNADTHTRLFAFPISDEKWDENFIIRVSRFETGAIYSINGGAAVFGNIYNAWTERGAESGELGYPIGELFNYHNGHVVYFERGCMWNGQTLGDKVVTGFIRPPQLGKPKIVNPSSPSDVAFKEMVAFVGLSVDEVKLLNTGFRPGLGNFFSNLWSTLFINRVTKDGEPREEIPLRPIDFSVTAVPGGQRPPVFDPGVSGAGSVGRPGGPKVVSRPGVFVFDGGGGTAGQTKTPSASIVGAIGPRWDDIGEPTSRIFFLSFAIPDGSVLKERGLYEIGTRLGERMGFTISPNSVYVRNDWINFGFIHATDIHANMRSDDIGNYLRRAAQDPDIGKMVDWTKGAEKWVNWNDSFRDMIKYANDLYDQGKIDFILVPGDIVDYVFTSSKEITANSLYSRTGGNFLYLEKIIMGQSPSPDQVRKTKNERLRVPMFTTLGNHDYRPIEYELCCSVSDPIVGIFGVKTVRQYADHNLNEDEGILISSGIKRHQAIFKLNKNPSTKLPLPYMKSVSAAQAAKFLITTKAHQAQSYYRAKINRENSYVLKLGPHRIVMIDVKHDIGIPTSSDTGALLKYIWKYIRGNEDISVATGGGPNSSGFTDFDLELTQQAITEAKSANPRGLVVIGIHNGPINLEDGHHVNHFRMTVHPHIDPKWIKDLLVRVKGTENTPDDPTRAELFLKDAANAGWSFSKTAHFKSGTNDFMLEYGVAKAKANEFMRICAGAGFESNNNADLILYGHHHQHEEYVIKWLDQRMTDLAYYTDFFTFNPTRYYASPHIKRGQKRIKIMIKDGADPSRVEPILVRETDSETGKSFKQWQLETPPFNNPLDKQSDKAEWWRIHSPLYLQTAALGARDTYGRLKVGESDMANKDLLFQGIRVITVNNNIISRIDTVNMETMRQQIGGR